MSLIEFVWFDPQDYFCEDGDTEKRQKTQEQKPQKTEEMLEMKTGNKQELKQR